LHNIASIWSSLGWKPGDDLPGGPWEFGRGMSSSEAAEMKQLKENVEKLKRF
jgi:hypothetical protein